VQKKTKKVLPLARGRGEAPQPHYYYLFDTNCVLYLSPENITILIAYRFMPPWRILRKAILERSITAMDIIKVKANSRTAAVAGAIAGVVREHKRAEVQAIGAGAVNQAVKALVLAKGYLAEDGIPVIAIPEFVDVEIDGKVRTAIKLTVEPR
jgi:stage V sporulation protein S